MTELFGVPREVVVVRGPVERGDQRGRTLGFPTANVSVAGLAVGDGVWAGWLDRADGSRHPTAVSVGGRPTFYGRTGLRLLEAHVLGLEADLYGEEVTVWLCHRLRAQRRFDGRDELVAQLGRDVARTAAWCRATGWSTQLRLRREPPSGSAVVHALGG